MQILYDIIILEINGHFGYSSDGLHLYANNLESIHDNFECSRDKIKGLFLDSPRVLGKLE